MLPTTLFTWATMLMAATAIPTEPKPTTATKSESKSMSTKTSSASAAPTGNNGNQFVNQCANLGISIADCTELLNIAALNGNSVSIGGPPAKGRTPVNNGQQFLNQCANFGISILDCAEVLNLAILNGNAVEINLDGLTKLVQALGISLSGVLGTVLGGLSAVLGGKLFPIPANAV